MATYRQAINFLYEREVVLTQRLQVIRRYRRILQAEKLHYESSNQNIPPERMDELIAAFQADWQIVQTNRDEVVARRALVDTQDPGT